MYCLHIDDVYITVRFSPHGGAITPVEMHGLWIDKMARWKALYLESCSRCQNLAKPIKSWISVPYFKNTKNLTSYRWPRQSHATRSRRVCVNGIESIATGSHRRWSNLCWWWNTYVLQSAIIDQLRAFIGGKTTVDIITFSVWMKTTNIPFSIHSFQLILYSKHKPLLEMTQSIPKRKTMTFNIPENWKKKKPAKKKKKEKPAKMYINIRQEKQ